MSDPNRPDEQTEPEQTEAGEQSDLTPDAGSADSASGSTPSDGTDPANTDPSNTDPAGSASETPQPRGGSRLFPQLPDDPRLIEAQERERAAAAQAADGATPDEPYVDPATVTSVMDSNELRASIEDGAAAPATPDSAGPASSASTPDLAGPAPANADSDAAPSITGTSPTLSNENWENWTDLDAPAQWREGSQDFQTPVSDDAADSRSVHQTPELDQDQHPGRNVLVAIAVGIILGAVFFGALSAGRAVVVVLVALLLVIGIAEFFGVARTVGYRPATLLGLAGVAGLTGAVYWRGLEAYPLLAALIVVTGFLWFLFGVEREHPTANFAVTTMGIAWIGGLGSFAALILREPHGDAVLIAAVTGTVAYDVLGYVIGTTTGQTRLAYRVSPHKTVEGLIGGVALSAVITSLVLYRFPGIFPFTENLFNAVWLAVLISLAAPLGDLGQSLIKRDMQVKDMGTVLPGHGGVLDRFDALLFVLPAAYYMSNYLLG